MNNNTKINSERRIIDEEVNLKFIINFFLRNKILISFCSILFFVFACIYSLTTKRIWEGKFQIVLDTNESESSLNIPINPQVLGNLSKSPSNLNTEVGILESPSVLLPVFEFIKLKNQEKYNNLVFGDWKENLKIQLKPNTSILNISYRDTDKEIILPVLKKITNLYQEYSSNNKNKILESTRKYLIKEINIFRKKSLKSLSTVQEYAIDNNLVEYEALFSNINKSQNPFQQLIQENSNPLNNISIENKRFLITNQINKIDIQLKKISEVKDKTIPLLYIASSIPELINEGLPQSLSLAQSELATLKTRFTIEDESILKKDEEINILKELIANKTLLYLKEKKLDLLASLESSIRPKEILLEYKKLIREAARDEKTLVNLENNLRSVDIEKSVIQPPWKLITKPNLLSKPASSPRKFIALLGLLTGFILSTLISLYREKKSNKIYEKDILEKLLSNQFLEYINIKDTESETDKILLLRDLIYSKSIQNTKLLPVGEIAKNKVLKFQENLLKNNDKKNEIDLIVSLKNISKINKNHILYIVAELKTIKYKDILILKKYIKLIEISIFGLILFEDD